MADFADVSMTYSSVLDIAQAIDEKRDAFVQMQNQLDRLVDNLSGQWRGVAQQEFATSYKSIRSKMKTIVTTMEKYSTEIRRTIQDQQETEHLAAKKHSELAVSDSISDSFASDSKTIARSMKVIKTDWVDEEFSEYPMWLRESLKETLEDYYKGKFGSEIVAAYDATQKLLDGDVIGALKKCANGIIKGEGFFGKLETKFYINSVLNGVDAYWKFIEEPSMTNLVQIGWNMGPKAVFETTGKAAWDIVKLVPGVSDFYDQHGVTDEDEAFNVMYTEWTRVFFGDNVADSVSTYYADNGGLFYGLVNGGKDIVNEVKKSCDEHGGIFGVWMSGWNSIFS